MHAADNYKKRTTHPDKELSKSLFHSNTIICADRGAIQIYLKKRMHSNLLRMTNSQRSYTIKWRTPDQKKYFSKDQSIIPLNGDESSPTKNKRWAAYISLHKNIRVREIDYWELISSYQSTYSRVI